MNLANIIKKHRSKIVETLNEKDEVFKQQHEFAWKAYNKLNFDRYVKLPLPDRKCRRLKNNAEHVTQNQNFIYFAVGFSFISLTTN